MLHWCIKGMLQEYINEGEADRQVRLEGEGEYEE